MILGVGETTTFTVVFTPVTVQPVQAEVTRDWFLGNDVPLPLRSLVQVLCRLLKLTDPQGETIGGEGYDFGFVPVGEIETADLEITNVGSADVVINGIDSNRPDFTVVSSG